ncbi:MAG TPA: PRC-barrel domain-containing protein [Polyangia bacterium]|jgi:sporulation protein YlmC with PRC-barrel domain|nr:PRC-barrel domain-containing protein [Polyangia bacterium]
MRLRFQDQVRGRTVIDATGRALGAVDEIYLDGDTLQVEGLRVKLRNDIADELGVPHRAFHPGLIDVPAQHVQALGDTVVLRVDVRTLWQPPVSPEPEPAPAP